MDEENVYFYYGTDNLELDITIPINPSHPSQKKFEFGNGFYLSEYVNVAIDYARNGQLDRYLQNMNCENEEDIKRLINGDIYNVNIHRYLINKKNIVNDNKITRICTDKFSYKKTIQDTIRGYKKDSTYAPEYYYTYGLLCGEFWDNNIEDLDKYENFEDECVKNMKKIVDDNGYEIDCIQLCLHKNKVAILKHEYVNINCEILKTDNEYLSIIYDLFKAGDAVKSAI